MNVNGQFCTFVLGDLLFGIEVEKVQEVIRFLQMTSVPLSPRTIGGLINLRGQIVTAIDLRRCLEMPDRNNDETPMNVVVRTDEGPVSFLVDEVGEVVNVNGETPELPPETLKGPYRRLLQAVYKLPDRLMIVVDTEKILQLETSAARQ